MGCPKLTKGAGEFCVFGSEIKTGRRGHSYNYKVSSIYGRIILKWIFREEGGVVCELADSWHW
jgi:hypothetical protein